MPYGDIQELKRGYSANFDSFMAVIDKSSDGHSEFYENMQEIVDWAKIMINETSSFQELIDSKQELKVANLINANLAAKEIFEVDKESGINRGFLAKIIKLSEKLEKEEKKLSEEANEKEKKDIEKNCCEILKEIEAEKLYFRGKVNDFLKFLETAGALKINEYD